MQVFSCCPPNARARYKLLRYAIFYITNCLNFMFPEQFLYPIALENNRQDDREYIKLLHSLLCWWVSFLRYVLDTLQDEVIRNILI